MDVKVGLLVSVCRYTRIGMPWGSNLWVLSWYCLLSDISAFVTGLRCRMDCNDVPYDIVSTDKSSIYVRDSIHMSVTPEYCVTLQKTLISFSLQLLQGMSGGNWKANTEQITVTVSSNNLDQHP